MTWTNIRAFLFNLDLEPKFASYIWLFFDQLAGILMDTGNLTSPHCTTKDKYMATLLLNGAGRFGSNGFYQIMRYKMYDISDLKVVDILRKDFKKWTRGGKPDATDSRLMVSNIGMSSIGISIEQFLAHEHSSTEEIKYFQLRGRYWSLLKLWNL